MSKESPETYEEKVKRALSRACSEFGRKDADRLDALADEDGIVDGCYRTKPAPFD